MFKNISIGTRIFSLLGIMLLFIAGVILAFLMETRAITQFGVSETQRIMLQDQKDKLQVATHSMAQSLGETLKGVESQDARIALIRAAVDPIRFEDDKSGYFFVYQGTTNVALPPKKELQGKDLGEVSDKNGVFYVRELAAQAGKGGGFVSYVFPKPGKGDQPKLGYAEMIPGTDFWIGTGIYVDNIDEAKTSIRSAMEDMVANRTTTILGVVVGIFVILVLPLSLGLIGSIVKPIRAATAAASQVAAGNLEVALEAEGKSEVGVLNHALGDMVATLRANIAEITEKTRLAEDKARASEVASREANEARAKAERAKAEGMMHAAQALEKVAEGISSAAEEISAQAEDISGGSDTQRDRIQTTATAMEEMSATVLEVARNAAHAAEEGKSTRDRAVNGAGVVARAMEAMRATEEKTRRLRETMGQLDERAKAIGNVITVINDIADQTNLLALNAAIEAARAGDAGRGFAVVADEVRKLAEKTMVATKEVGESINAIQHVADENVRGMEAAVGDLARAAQLSTESGKALDEIVEGTEQAAAQIQAIATAAEEQSSATEEISSSVEEINSIAQSTARSVEETTVALRALAEQSSALMALIRDLKAEGEGTKA
ncbi:methyl-accepting chemotaxis sensory transducer with Cache sensor [Desulfovibrio sp. X2]|uniref:methyl-accepting chemotaxis protein n=1 Tax=Desulfovibrio sp. X2 TaxID=941449 RepID=UPI000358AD85|nr:methyl-accepting chemotaxis protein [Desulfovibrio sp. X2]EPR41599.1 methyl-accepting chemotaxis sensory transducer with Cache sensor [Desulfovibrio sp. X2]